MSKAIEFLKKALGEDIFETLQKTELYKPDTRTVTSLEDIHHGLKLVPRTIMALLIRELVPMQVNDHKDIFLPVTGQMPTLHVEKLGPDVYSGQIIVDNKKIAEFAYRPIPGVALVVMSAFELYSVEEETQYNAEDAIQSNRSREVEIQQFIDERLALHDLINRVVDKKIEQKDAIQALMLAKLTQALQPLPPPVEVKKEIKIEEPKKKELPLKEFLEGRKSKLKKNEFFISLEKNDTVNCHDCGKEIFNSSGFSGCICYGENMNSKVSIKKAENGVRISFGRGWDQENLEMLLEVLRCRRVSEQ